MGLFGRNKNSQANSNVSEEAVIEPAIKNSEDLKNLYNEFNSNQTADYEEYEEPVEEVLEEEYEEPVEDVVEEEPLEEELEEEIIEDEHAGGEEYEVSEDESASIESFLSSPEEEIEEEPVYEESVEEEVVEEEPIEEVVEETIEPEEFVQEESEPEEEIEEAAEEPETEVIPEKEEQVAENYVTSEDIDKKFDEFEKRLLEKLMSSMAMFSGAQNAQETKPSSKTSSKKKEEKQADSEDVSLSYKNGKLVIDDYTCTGEVVMFTTFDSVKKASWEEVVRRKGHCTYHLTASGNGGYFIKKSNAPNPYAYIEKKEDAIELAKAYAKREKAELKIHNAKGVIEQSLSYGREKLRG